MKKLIKDTIIPKGIVERRLFDTKKFYTLLKLNDVILKEIEYYSFNSLILEGNKKLGEKLTAKILENSAKKQFSDNFLWKIIKKVLNIDLRINFITGYYTKNAIRSNLVVNTGHKKVADQTGGTATAPIIAVAIGIGTTPAASTDTALQSEITTGGGSRSAGSTSVLNTTTNTSGDTEQWTRVFTFTASFAVTEEGLFDSNTNSSGILLAHQVFSAINVNNGDSLQIVHKLVC